MNAAAELPEPFWAEVTVDRAAGEPAAGPVWVAFAPAFRQLPATLCLGRGWDGARFREFDRYTVGVKWRGPVCDVTLGREPAKVRAVGPGGDRQPAYTVSIIGGGGWCTCRGFTLAAEDRRPCKHVAALARIVAEGLLSQGTP
jgi:hypothetical protein